MEWYQLQLHQLEEKLDSSILSGLSEQEAAIRIALHGHNKLTTKKQITWWQILLNQFRSPVIYLLVIAAIISVSLNDIAESIAIVVVIVINTAIGFYMEWQAMTTMKSLKELDILRAKVIRDGILKEISSEELTMGDLISIEAGDLITADARLVTTHQLQTDESALTGESLPLVKSAEAIAGLVTIADRSNMLFKGTIAVKGNAHALVTSIGMDTELGKISKLVQSADQSATPLEKRLDKLTRKLIWLTVFIAAAFFVAGWIKGYQIFQMLETSIAMAVAAIPEGLPIVATIALGYGMVKMARKNVIVKHLAAVETLGSANVILTDKTGTLTENKIVISRLVTADDKREQPLETNDHPGIEKLLFVATLCNDAMIGDGKETGDPLEVALLKWAEENEYDTASARNKYPRTGEEPFSSETKLMKTYHQHLGNSYVCVKGATETVLKKCRWEITIDGVTRLNESRLKYWHSEMTMAASNGSRVLCFAYQETDSRQEQEVNEELIIAGMIGFRDPPSEKIPAAIEQCLQAGIKVVVLTGDHPATALFIAREINLADDEAIVINGIELADPESWDENQKQRLLSASVFARVTPAQKLDIVKLYQENGYITAMTGDGVNDAPALKKADIGIAMGIRGTQIAKETADLVLKDDSFISIVAAVKQGRIIFENIRKCIMFLLSCNLSEILVISVSVILSVASPLTPLQILYLNVVTDVFPALALAASRGNLNIMKQPPRDPAEGLLVTRDWSAIILYSVIITFSIFTVFIYCHYYLGLDVRSGNTVVFLSLALAQLWHVFNLPSSQVSFFRNEITENKYIWMAVALCLLIMVITYVVEPVRNVLQISDINGRLLLIILTASLLPVLFIQILKRLKMID
jgi:P-type Ca2+ transporter type 2C